jgi:hypothetical protein
MNLAWFLPIVWIVLVYGAYHAIVIQFHHVCKQFDPHFLWLPINWIVIVAFAVLTGWYEQMGIFLAILFCILLVMQWRYDKVFPSVISWVPLFLLLLPTFVMINILERLESIK